MTKYIIVKTNVEGQDYFKIQHLVNQESGWQDWVIRNKDRDIPHIAPGKPDLNQQPDLIIKDYTGNFMAVPVYKTQQKAQNQIAFLTQRFEKAKIKSLLEDAEWKVVSRSEVEVDGDL